MLVVHFPQELHERAPDAIGRLCVAPNAIWTSLVELAAIVNRGEIVTIRPASDAEVRRAEAYVSLYEIGQAMNEKIGALLDKESPEAVQAKITAVRDAIDSVDIKLPALLDPVGAAQAL
jgi:hypothetical protein